MKNIRKCFVIFLAMLFFGSLIVTNFGGAALSWTPEVRIVDIELDPPYQAWDGSYGNQDYWVTVIVENSGKTKLTDLNVSCTIMDSGDIVYLDEYNTTVTDLGIWEVAEFDFHWTNTMDTTLFTINASVIADSFGTIVGPDYMELEVNIDNTSSYTVPDLDWDPEALKLMVGGLEAIPAYNGAWALYFNDSGVFNPINYTPKVRILNDGNQDITDLEVLGEFYDGPAPVGVPDWSNTTTVSSLPAGLWKYTNFAPDFFNSSTPGIKTLNVSSGGLNFSMNFELMDILDVNVTEFVGLEDGGVYNNYTGDVQVMIKNSGNINLSAIGNFSVRLTISNSSGPQYTSSLVTVDAGKGGSIYNPGQITMITFSNINTTFPDDEYTFKVDLIGVDETVYNGILLNNVLAINVTFVNITDFSILTTSPIPGKYHIDDVTNNKIMIGATVFNDGTEDVFPSGYWLEVSYENIDTGEKWVNVTNKSISGPIVPYANKETDLGSWISVIDYNGNFNLTVALSLVKNGTILDSDTIQVTLGGPANGTISGQVTGVTQPAQVVVKAFAVGTTDPILTVTTTGTGTTRDYTMNIFGTTVGEEYEIKALEADNYWYDTATAAPNPKVMSGRPTEGINLVLTSKATGHINGTVTLEPKAGAPNLDPDVINVTQSIVMVEGTPVSMSPDIDGSYNMEAVVGGLLNVTAELANFMGDYNDNVTVQAGDSTIVNLTLTELWDVVVTPAHGAIKVSRDTTVKAVFANEIDTDTLSLDSFRIIHGTTTLTGLNVTQHYFWSNSNKTCTITPPAALVAGDTYYVEITPELKTTSDAPAVHRDWYSRFTVAVGYGHVSGYVTDKIDKSVIANANVSIGAIFTHTDSNGMYELQDITPGQQTIKVTADWYQNGSLNVQILAGVTIENKNISLSRAPPSVIVTPSNGATNVELTASVVAIFGSAMNVSSITTNTFTLKETDTSKTVEGTIIVSKDNKTFTFKPTLDLSGLTNYTITLSKTIKKMNSTENWYNWDAEYKFKTRAGPDFIEVTSVIPANGATKVNLDTTITVTFNLAIDASSFQAAFRISPSAGILKYEWSNQNKTVKITFSEKLEGETVYTCTIGKSDLKPLIGTRTLVTDYSWAFTTKAEGYTIIIGPIVNEQGEPIANAKVTIVVENKTYYAYTNESGYARLILPEQPEPGEYKVIIEKEDYEPQIIYVTVPADGEPTVPTPAPMKAKEDKEDGIESMLIIALVIVIIIVIILLALAMMRKKPAEEEELLEEEELEGEEFECPECGALVAPGEPGCPECGAEFGEEEELEDEEGLEEEEEEEEPIEEEEEPEEEEPVEEAEEEELEEEEQEEEAEAEEEEPEAEAEEEESEAEAEEEAITEEEAEAEEEIKEEEPEEEEPEAEEPEEEEPEEEVPEEKEPEVEEEEFEEDAGVEEEDFEEEFEEEFEEDKEK